ncbi:hypothetical protein CZ774_08025 [Frigoribacterium sp. JB110]|nr:hypothetical protein CZ774_08025 [Frigoribacterium sp. JB110]
MRVFIIASVGPTRGGFRGFRSATAFDAGAGFVLAVGLGRGADVAAGSSSLGG